MGKRRSCSCCHAAVLFAALASSTVGTATTRRSDRSSDRPLQTLHAALSKLRRPTLVVASLAVAVGLAGETLNYGLHKFAPPVAVEVQLQRYGGSETAHFLRVLGASFADKLEFSLFHWGAQYGEKRSKCGDNARQDGLVQHLVREQHPQKGSSLVAISFPKSVLSDLPDGFWRKSDGGNPVILLRRAGMLTEIIPSTAPTQGCALAPP